MGEKVYCEFCGEPIQDKCFFITIMYTCHFRLCEFCHNIWKQWGGKPGIKRRA